MEKKDLAAHFQGVRMNGNGFRARCPVHGSRGQTLAVKRGDRGWIVKCFAGCSFADVAEAAGLPQSAFMFGDVSHSTSTHRSSLPARRKLAQMIEAKRYIPTSFSEIADIAFSPPVERLVETDLAYPEIAMMRFPDAMRMWTVSIDGYMAMLLEDKWRSISGNWHEARDQIMERLWDQWRETTKGLM
jgi:hypothetical protein